MLLQNSQIAFPPKALATSVPTHPPITQETGMARNLTGQKHPLQFNPIQSSGTPN